MGASNSRFRAGSLRILRTLSGGRFRGGSSAKYGSNSTSVSMDNINGGCKGSSSRQTSSGTSKPKSESVRYKTKWPYPHVEKDFLPVYNMKPENQKDFTISHVIASGAYGSVLRGYETKTKRDVAVKVIDKARVLSEGQGAIQQCKDEVLIQSELVKSPFIVELVAFWQTRNRLYLVLEYIPNGELFDLWKTVRLFSESLARFYISQITLALDFLHRNNVVYRDLKMENILLDSQARIKLIDFGLSKQLRDGERTTTTCGTLQYTAPEVLRGEPYGREIDWWSMGILGYAILSGKFPVFGARDHVEMRHMVASHQYRMPLHLSNEAADLLTMLLQKNPDNRVHNLDDLLNLRFYHNILHNTSDIKQHLRDFITKQDMDKITDSYPMKPLFEAAYKASVIQRVDSVPSKDEDDSTTTNTTTSDNTDYAEPIWTMNTGQSNNVPANVPQPPLRKPNINVNKRPISMETKPMRNYPTASLSSSANYANLPRHNKPHNLTNNSNNNLANYSNLVVTNNSNNQQQQQQQQTQQFLYYQQQARASQI